MRSAAGAVVSQGRRHAVAAGAALLAALSAVALPPAGAGAADLTLLDHLPARAHAAVAARLDRDARLRRAEADPSYVTRVRGLMSAAGLTPPAVPALPAPSGADVQRTAGLPAPLRAPVAGMWAAMAAAMAQLGPLPVAELRQEWRDVITGFDASPQRQRAGAFAPPAAGLTATAYPQKFLAPGPVFAPFRPGPATAHALRADPEATLLVAAALDRYVPQLLAARGQVAGAPRAAAADGCDLLDQAPYLCVASAAGNTFTASSVLLIALGGNNTYLNSAGGAPIALPSAPAALPLSVNLDLGGGTDRYDPAPLDLGLMPPPAAAPTVGEGVGMFGAVGISVNLGGDDTYTATAPPPAGAAQAGAIKVTSVIAQGVGFAGTGLLFDLGGADSYDLAAAPDPTFSGIRTLVIGQGAGAIDAGAGCSLSSRPPACAIGALVQLGGGADSYTLDGRTIDATHATGYTGSVTVLGQGETGNQVGILFDDGGDDTITARAAENGPPAVVSFAPVNDVLVQGTAAGAGLGLLVEGQGNKSYVVRTTGTAAAYYTVGGQGFGYTEGQGVLDDAGGRSTFTLKESLTDERTLTIDGSCGCAQAAARVVDYQPVGQLELLGQGMGWSGQGLLHAGPGEDTYSAAVLEDSRITLDDELPAPAAPPSLTVIGHDSPLVWVQGAAFSIAAPQGELVNEGTGHFAVQALDSTEAVATSAHAAGIPQVTGVSIPQTPAEDGQGYSWGVYANVGSLLDGGGTGDSASVDVGNPVTTTPDTGHAVRFGGVWPEFQGQGYGGTFYLGGSGAQDHLSPAPGVCPASPGHPGFGAWAYCQDPNPAPDADHSQYDAMGFGYAGADVPNNTGSAPTLTLVAPPAQALDPGSVSVSARLLDPAGRPLAGAVVHFNLQYEFPFSHVFGGPVQETWGNEWQADGTTDATGLATARIGLDSPLFGLVLPSQLGYPTQLLATFDGAPGVYPRHVATPITIAAAGPPATVPEAPLAALLPLLGLVAAALRFWRQGSRRPE